MNDLLIALPYLALATAFSVSLYALHRQRRLTIEARIAAVQFHFQLMGYRVLSDGVIPEGMTVIPIRPTPALLAAGWGVGGPDAENKPTQQEIERAIHQWNCLMIAIARHNQGVVDGRGI